VPHREFAPPSRLASHVACVWARTDAPARVLPDGCVDIVWTGERLIVAGPATRSVMPSVSPDRPKLGIRFRIGAAGAALGLPAAELRDRSPQLGELWDDGDELAERVGEGDGVAARFAILTDALAARLADAAPPDPIVRAALGEVSRPRTRIERLGTGLHLSQRQLRRRFEAAVGYPPRTLARVLRLQRFLGLAQHGGELARIAAEAGFADQPHLTRECSELGGLPAAALVASGAAPAGERLS
jgi:AraC-like DNA-binding protein